MAGHPGDVRINASHNSADKVEDSGHGEDGGEERVADAGGWRWGDPGAHGDMLPTGRLVPAVFFIEGLQVSADAFDAGPRHKNGRGDYESDRTAFANGRAKRPVLFEGEVR
jgi:hypothetical protein